MVAILICMLAMFMSASLTLAGTRYVLGGFSCHKCIFLLNADTTVHVEEYITPSDGSWGAVRRFVSDAYATKWFAFAAAGKECSQGLVVEVKVYELNSRMLFFMNEYDWTKDIQSPSQKHVEIGREDCCLSTPLDFVKYRSYYSLRQKLLIYVTESETQAEIRYRHYCPPSATPSPTPASLSPTSAPSSSKPAFLAPTTTFMSPTPAFLSPTPEPSAALSPTSSPTDNGDNLTPIENNHVVDRVDPNKDRGGEPGRRRSFVVYLIIPIFLVLPGVSIASYVGLRRYPTQRERVNRLWEYVKGGANGFLSRVWSRAENPRGLAQGLIERNAGDELELLST